MELKAKLENLYQRVDGLKDSINTEEATKTAFIMPFLQMLGYDIFNPTEVVPEFVADIGTKKGEKVDYAILKDDEPVIIIECKHWQENADAHNSQLHRYYNVSNAQFGIMTNGIIYNFFTDLEKANIMDEKPFLTVDLSNLKDSTIKELEKFSKQTFDIDDILSSAEALKYVKAIRAEFEKELQEPSDDFIKLIVKRFFDRQITANRLDVFREYFKRAITASFNETINTRLKSALSINEKKGNADNDESSSNNEETKSKIITTDEELEAFQIIKAILREKISSERIAHRDTQSYFGILLDDTNRQPLCRLHFNTRNKYLELFHNGQGEKVQIENLDEIYNYKRELLEAIEIYE